MFACRLCSNLGSKIVQSLASMLKNIVSYPPLTHAFLKWPFLTDFKKYTHTPPLRNEILVLWTKNGENPENTRICSALACYECPREICGGLLKKKQQLIHRGSGPSSRIWRGGGGEVWGEWSFLFCTRTFEFPQKPLYTRRVKAISTPPHHHRLPKKTFQRLWQMVWAKRGPDLLNTLDLRGAGSESRRPRGIKLPPNAMAMTVGGRQPNAFLAAN